jgi:hypothetical protein
MRVIAAVGRMLEGLALALIWVKLRDRLGWEGGIAALYLLARLAWAFLDRDEGIRDAEKRLAEAEKELEQFRTRY